jgi:GTP cyclohydrolase I
MIVREIPFTSLCEHHFMPMDGKIWIAYIPHEKVLGLNKIDRIAKYYCAKLQQQERIVTNIADWIMDNVEPTGVMVVCKGTHYCAIMQGDMGDFYTSAVRGIFKEVSTVKGEALRLMKL